MKWEGNRESDNVEDRRGEDGGGGGGGFGFGGRSIGIGTIVIALVGSYVLGVNPLTLLNLLSGGGGQVSTQQSQSPARQPPESDDMARFVKTVLADTEDTWSALFRPKAAAT
jgi:predicted metalloprotease